MKRILFLCMCMLMAFSASAQDESPTANWPYLFPDFVEGELLRTNRQSNKAMFNIHLNQSELHYVDDGKIRRVDTWGVLGLRVGDDLFRLVEGRAVKVLAETAGGSVVQESRGNYASIVKDDGAYGTSSLSSTTTKTYLYNGNAINQYDGYLLTDDYKDLHAMKNQSEKLPVRTNKFLVIGNRLIPANKQSVAAIDGVDKKAFSAFLKAEKIKWNDVQDLVKVVDFVSAK